MMYQVGSPDMLLGNRFFPLTGTPISNIEFRRIRLDDWDPVPLAVATLITKSFIDTSILGIHILASVHQQCERAVADA